MPTRPPDIPPHLWDCEWRFVCECGLNWHVRTSAVVVDGKVTAPARQCATCGKWVDGHPILESS